MTGGHFSFYQSSHSPYLRCVWGVTCSLQPDSSLHPVFSLIRVGQGWVWGQVLKFHWAYGVCNQQSYQAPILLPYSCSQAATRSTFLAWGSLRWQLGGCPKHLFLPAFVRTVAPPILVTLSNSKGQCRQWIWILLCVLRSLWWDPQSGLEFMWFQNTFEMMSNWVVRLTLDSQCP